MCPSKQWKRQLNWTRYLKVFSLFSGIIWRHNSANKPKQVRKFERSSSEWIYGRTKFLQSTRKMKMCSAKGNELGQEPGKKESAEKSFAISFAFSIV